MLIFGNFLDLFTDRTFSLCKLDFTFFDRFCPPGVHLTATNFLAEYK